jgi:C4-dicarboxylate-specific signal transduction histidine kinase
VRIIASRPVKKAIDARFEAAHRLELVRNPLIPRVLNSDVEPFRVATLGDLAAAIAHEVNQPLTGLVSNGNA